MKSFRLTGLLLSTLVAGFAQEPRLTQVSVQATTGDGASVLIAGFVIGPGTPKQVLIRTLGQPPFHQAGAIADPVLVLFDRDHRIVATNDDWLAPADFRVAAAGAGPFASGNQDAAVVATLAPGSYTAQVNRADRSTGIAHLEMQEVEAAGPRLLNASARLQVGTERAATLGFTLSPGRGKRRLLVRASGPALAAYGVTAAVANPALALTTLDGAVLLATNEDWAVPADADAPTAQSLAAAFTRAGAFGFDPAGKDAAILVDLPAGRYSATVTGGPGETGLSLVEIFDLTGPSAPPTTTPQIAAAILPASGASPAATTAATPTHSADVNGDFRLDLPELLRLIELYNARNGTVRTGRYKVHAGTEDGFNIDASTPAVALVTLAKYHSADSNQDGALSLPELLRTIEIYNFRAGTVRLGQYYSRTGTEDGFSPGAATLVTIVATKSAGDETGANPAEFTVANAGDTTFPVVVAYTVAGTASSGADFPALPGTVTIPAGATSVTVPLAPNPDVETEATETVIITLSSSPYYNLGAAGTATATIADSPATLYIAALRPELSASDSIASGTATLALSASGTLALVNVSFSNLSTSQASAHLRISPSGDFVAGLPYGQVNARIWLMNPVGNYTPQNLLDALRQGKIYVGIDTSKYPSGELKGPFIQGAGTQAFTPPPAPPAVNLTNATAAAAARLLTQATYGPKRSEIDALTGQSLATWIDAQLALPFTSHRTATIADRTNFGGSSSTTNWNALHPPNRQVAWFTIALTAPDQLRQRVAFALSELFVVSDISLGNDNHAEPLAAYYDLLGAGAFGNFRTLLENVTLSPMMGLYLSSLRNAKADPVAGTTPDENFAREIMQLFSIGLSELQPDGTLHLGADAFPIATYNQATVTEMAKVFTGWAYPSTNLNNFRTAGINYFSPMQLFPAFHDDTAKTIVGGAALPAAQGGLSDLRMALDALFNHPNTGPFVARHLIQRLITSNPSPAFVYRVAQLFANNGAGVRGDLAAVVRAIYTDYEARSPAVASNLAFGKLKEPLLRLTALLRGFSASAPNGRYAGFRNSVDGVPITSATPLPATGAVISSNSTSTNLAGVQSRLAQAALRSPTVFNFFNPDHVEPGPLAAAGLVAPEFQITDDTTAIDVPNYLRQFITASSAGTTNAALATLELNLTYEQSLIPTPAALVDYLALVLTANTLPTAARDRILSGLQALPASATTLDRARSAVLFVATTPAAAIQK